MNPTIHLYQIIIVVVAAIMLYQGSVNYFKKKNGQTFFKLFIRIAVWGGMALVALFPSFTNFLANIIGIKGNINAVILTGFLLIFLMIFKLLSAIERLEQNISTITRTDSLKEINPNQNKL
ncbi:MAG: hypothetical protein ACD_11C00018G0037 [uncultured bacterium]|nr:MAG: hypothetical protein ACD_11C00018G0037 [uncultured bacterium]HBR71562.1 hypothetical protein [Candidatus Moranbacteria bacterium]